MVRSSFVIGHSSTGILKIADGYVCGLGKFNRGIPLGLATSKNTAGYAEVTISGGALVSWGATDVSWPAGAHSGFTVAETFAEPCRSYAKVNMSGGVITNRSYYYVGKGPGATGIVEQTGGQIVNGVGASSDLVFIGFGGGYGSHTMSNGIFTAFKTVYIGGLPEALWFTGGDWGNYTNLYKSKRSVGLLCLDGGTFDVSNADIRVGGQGEGTLVIGQNAMCVADNIVLDTNTSSVVRFDFGASGIGTLRANGALTICEGARLEVDTRAYTGHAEWVKLIDCCTRVGAFAPQDISVMGRGVVRQDLDSSAIWLNIPSRHTLLSIL